MRAFVTEVGAIAQTAPLFVACPATGSHVAPVRGRVEDGAGARERFGFGATAAARSRRSGQRTRLHALSCERLQKCAQSTPNFDIRFAAMGVLHSAANLAGLRGRRIRLDRSASRIWPEALRAGPAEAGLPSVAIRPPFFHAVAAHALDRFVDHALPTELLTLYESARTMPLPTFELAASRQLGRLVGFDGAVWGVGGCGPGAGRFNISRASLLDRPPQLLSDYASVAACDPVTAAFARAPHRLQVVNVLRDYRHAQVQPMRDYLQAYGIGQLMLMGAPYAAGAGTTPGALSWITAYRAPADKPFDARDSVVFQTLLPHWLCARRLCAAIHGEPDLPRGATATPRRRPDQLSAREHEVLNLVARGFTYGEAAQRLGVSVTTVYSHARNIYAKLDVHNKTEAVFEARQLGLL